MGRRLANPPDEPDPKNNESGTIVDKSTAAESHLTELTPRAVAALFSLARSVSIWMPLGSGCHLPSQGCVTLDRSGGGGSSREPRMVTGQSPKQATPLTPKSARSRPSFGRQSGSSERDPRPTSKLVDAEPDLCASERVDQEAGLRNATVRVVGRLSAKKQVGLVLKPVSSAPSFARSRRHPEI